MCMTSKMPTHIPTDTCMYTCACIKTDIHDTHLYKQTHKNMHIRPCT